jgi:hypothetical protein
METAVAEGDHYPADAEDAEDTDWPADGEEPQVSNFFSTFPSSEEDPNKLPTLPKHISYFWARGFIHSLTSKLNLRTYGNTTLTLELNLSTSRTHPRVNTGYVGTK